MKKISAFNSKLIITELTGSWTSLFVMRSSSKDESNVEILIQESHDILSNNFLPLFKK